MDATSLRAEIKAWERHFKHTHKREPTVQDIKDQPKIADKYKNYKKLSKAQAGAKMNERSAISSFQFDSTNPPSTPPRSTLASSSLLPKPRPAPSPAPTLTSNPFSPIKAKAKRFSRERSPDTPQLPNPFVTPRKGGSRKVPIPPNPSSDPFAMPTSPRRLTSPPDAIPVDPDIHKARKRLRGDPVSPSPRGKEKKRRIANSSKSELDQVSSEGEVEEGDTSYMDESPVKPPAGGKDFKVLFDESQSANGVASRSGALFMNSRPFIGGLKSSQAIENFDDESELPSRARRLYILDEGPQRSLKDSKPKGLVPKGMFARAVDMNLDSMASSSMNIGQRQAAASKTEPIGRKRGSSTHDTPMAVDVDGAGGSLALIPPSPPSGCPQQTLNRVQQQKGKGKAVDRKRARLTTDVGAGADSPDDEADVKILELDRRMAARVPNGRNTWQGDDLDSDPVLGLDLHSRAAHDLDAENGQGVAGEFQVDLPDDLRRILVISPSRVRDRAEQAIVKSLLFGMRRGAQGEVWDVGEVDGSVNGDSNDGEDDWAGEGVPWEVGEL